MALKKKWTSKHILSILFMFAITYLSIDILWVSGSCKMNLIIQLLIISTVMLALLILNLEFFRIDSRYEEELIHDYYLIATMYAVACVIFMGMAIFKAPMIPIGIVGIMFTIGVDRYSGLLFSIYFTLLFYIISDPGYMYLIYYVVMSAIICVISEYFTDKSKFPALGIITIITHVLIITALDYFALNLISYDIILRSFICGIVVFVFGILFSLFIKKYLFKKTTGKINELVDEEHSILQKLKEISPESYSHCIRTGRLAFEGAKKINSDELLAQAGGYYCRVGLLSEGKNAVDNIAIGEYYKFPRKLIELIYQAEAGTAGIPTTKEAAIVMLADTCISAIENLEKNSGRSGWNKEIVIQQIFLAKSNEGLLEKSGITMKMYLDLKECFATECNK